MQVRTKCAEFFLTRETMLLEFLCLFCNEWFDQYDEFTVHLPKCSSVDPPVPSASATHSDDANDPNDYTNGDNETPSVATDEFDEEQQCQEEYLLEELNIKIEADDDDIGSSAFDDADDDEETESTLKLPDDDAPKPQKTRKRKYNKTYTCEFCGSAFTQINNLTSHIRVHTGEKPYECKECGRKFNQSTTLKMHVNVIHAGYKPHKCERCEMSFSKPGILKKHVDFKHLNIPVVKRYECDVCLIGFQAVRKLQEHSRTHTGERPFACDFCERRFGRREAWKVHENIHTGHSPFQCKHCDRAFHSSAARRSHEKGVHKIK